MGVMAAGIGAGALGSYLSSKSAGEAAEQAAAVAAAESGRQFDAAMAEMQEAASYLESIGVPPAEAQRIALERAQLGPSAMEDIQTDPRLQNAQMDALASLQQMGGAGLTEEEKVQQMMNMRSSGAQAQAQDKAILQNMAERGMGGSGSELIQRLQASQSAADRNSLAQAQLSGQAQNRALNAISQAGQLGGQIRGQSFGEQSQVASAKDRIAEFNEQNRANTMNQQEIYNQGLAQQEYENEMAKRQAVAAARTGTAQAGMQRAGQTLQAGQAAAQGQIQQGQAQSQLIGDLAKAGASAYSNYNNQNKKDGGVVKYENGGMVMEQQQMQSGPINRAPNSNGGFADGGPVGTAGYQEGYAGGGMPVPEMEDDRIIPGDSFEDDRIDAKINSGEMVLNIEQQQRLMELLKGLRDLQGLGDEDIVEPSQGQMPPQEMQVAVMEEPQFENGGMVPSEYKTKTEAKPRGLHATLKHEKDSEEKASNDSKARKARIKACEVLINGGR